MAEQDRIAKELSWLSFNERVLQGASRAFAGLLSKEF